MGTRYVLEMKCEKCGYVDDNVYFAPTCGFTNWVCENCGHEIDLCKNTGITYEDASNANVIDDAVKNLWRDLNG